MKKHITQHQKDERARRQAMGIALIERPLKLIYSRTGTMGRDSSGYPVYISSHTYSQSYAHAKSGNGAAVQRIARQVL